MVDKTVPVIIVGAGPTGLTAANLLGLYGIQTIVIERNTEPRDFPRAISIDDEGLRICQMLGLRSEILATVRLDLGAQYLSHGRLLARVTPHSWPNGYPLISTFEQPSLEATLLAGLQRFPGVEIRLGHTLENLEQTAQQVLAHIRQPDGSTQIIACTYLLACDGGKSSVRQALGIPMRGTTFRQRWLVVDGICEKHSQPASHITFFCNPERSAVSLPAPGQNWRWEFMLLPGEDASSALENAHLRQLIRELGDTREPQIRRKNTYTFHAQRAASFHFGRVFLLGDAAHQLPPFGGQGMNCGLRDASNLAWKLALVLKRQISTAALKTYHQERMPHTVRMIRFSTFLGGIIMPTNHQRARLRDAILRILLASRQATAFLDEMRVKPASFYRAGFRSATHRTFAGQLLPQPLLTSLDNTQIPLDDLLGPGFAIVRLFPCPAEAFKPLQADLWHNLSPRYLCIVPASEPLPDMVPGVECARDDQQFAQFVQHNRNLFILVRPDRYVYGAFSSNSEQIFAKDLQKWLTLQAQLETPVVQNYL